MENICELQRGAGILLPVSSLPSPYGIGTFGKAAYAFVDQLVEAGQRYWQGLPLGPTMEIARTSLFRLLLEIRISLIWICCVKRDY